MLFKKHIVASHKILRFFFLHFFFSLDTNRKKKITFLETIVLIFLDFLFKTYFQVTEVKS